MLASDGSEWDKDDLTGACYVSWGWLTRFTPPRTSCHATQRKWWWSEQTFLSYHHNWGSEPSKRKVNGWLPGFRYQWKHLSTLGNLEECSCSLRGPSLHRDIMGSIPERRWELLPLDSATFLHVKAATTRYGPFHPPHSSSRRVQSVARQVWCLWQSATRPVHTAVFVHVPSVDQKASRTTYSWLAWNVEQSTRSTKPWCTQNSRSYHL